MKLPVIALFAYLSVTIISVDGSYAQSNSAVLIEGDFDISTTIENGNVAAISIGRGASATTSVGTISYCNEEFGGNLTVGVINSTNTSVAIGRNTVAGSVNIGNDFCGRGIVSGSSVYEPLSSGSFNPEKASLHDSVSFSGGIFIDEKNWCLENDCPDNILKSALVALASEKFTEFRAADFSILNGVNLNSIINSIDELYKKLDMKLSLRDGGKGIFKSEWKICSKIEVGLSSWDCRRKIDFDIRRHNKRDQEFWFTAECRKEIKPPRGDWRDQIDQPLKDFCREAVTFFVEKVIK